MSAANGRDCGEDVAAYVLGALEPDEAEAFRRHIADCAECREEVAAFEQVTEALPPAGAVLCRPEGPQAARHARGPRRAEERDRRARRPRRRAVATGRCSPGAARWPRS